MTDKESPQIAQVLRDSAFLTACFVGVAYLLGSSMVYLKYKFVGIPSAIAPDVPFESRVLDGSVTILLTLFILTSLRYSIKSEKMLDRFQTFPEGLRIAWGIALLYFFASTVGMGLAFIFSIKMVHESPRVASISTVDPRMSEKVVGLRFLGVGDAGYAFRCDSPQYTCITLTQSEVQTMELSWRGWRPK